MERQQKVVLITGATGILGRTAARAFAAQASGVILTSTSMKKLEALKRALHLPDDRVLLLAGDLSQPGVARDIVAAGLRAFGRIDIVLHLVGGWQGGKVVEQYEDAAVELMLRQHLWTTLYLLRAVLPGMKSNAWGRILAISSPTASSPTAMTAPYAIGKAAQEALILTTARETIETGITANVLLVKSIAARSSAGLPSTAEVDDATTPEEITAALLALTADEPEPVNGKRIPLYDQQREDGLLPIAQ